LANGSKKGKPKSGYENGGWGFLKELLKRGFWEGGGGGLCRGGGGQAALWGGEGFIRS